MLLFACELVTVIIDWLVCIIIALDLDQYVEFVCVRTCHASVHHVAGNPAEGKASPRTGRKALQKGFK